MSGRRLAVKLNGGIDDLCVLPQISYRALKPKPLNHAQKDPEPSLHHVSVVQRSKGSGLGSRVYGVGH